MKSTFLLFFFALISSAIIAQTGIGFQGIARDPQGNAITNQDISVKFTIGAFVEVQDISTDDFGVFSATIGSVETADFGNLVFANINENLKVEVDGTIIYDDKFNTVPYAKAAENGVPPGSIMPFAGAKNNVPAGWLFCDGRSIAKTGMYQKLYNTIGILWGDDGGNFRIPDLRGVFLRGANEGRTDIYANTESKTVGEFQDDGIKKHTHPITDPGHIHGITDPQHSHPIDLDDNTGGGGIDDAGNSSDGSTTSEPAATGISINTGYTNITVNEQGTLNETRPVNASINYIIKY